MSEQKKGNRTLVLVPPVMGVVKKKTNWVMTFAEAANTPFGIVLTILFSIAAGVGFNILFSQRNSPSALVPAPDPAVVASKIPISVPPSPTPTSAVAASTAPIAVPPPPTPAAAAVASSASMSVPPPPTPAAAAVASTASMSVPPPPTTTAAAVASTAPMSVPPPPTQAAAVAASTAPVSVPPPPTPAAAAAASTAPVSVPPPPTPAGAAAASKAPTSVPPRPNSTVALPDRDEVAAQIARGRAALSNGDVAGARLILRWAAEHDDPQAALALGETYDAAVLKRLGIIKFADPVLAREWYRRAADLGSAVAISRLDQLSKADQLSR